MNTTQPAQFDPREVLRILTVYWRRWVLPAAALALAAASYAAVSRPTWQAAQALILRNAAADGAAEPGKFSRSEDMKTVQETILELLKSHDVLAAALQEVGPAANHRRNEAWPSERDVDVLRGAVKIAAPKGAEFGATEVFYLDVQDHDRAHAVALNKAVCRHLQVGFQKLRNAKAQSMSDELEQAAQLARADLQQATVRLAKIEKQVGGDLAELRSLEESSSGETSLHRTVTEIENELRQARAGEKADGQLLALLREAERDPGRLLAVPGRMLDAVPALRRLKDGLVDAQLHTANLEGRLSAEHPHVIAARQAEEQISRELHKELNIAVRGAEVDLKLNSERIAMLEGQLRQTAERLSGLAGLRSVYANCLADHSQHAKLLERAEQNLAEARAARATAKAASLIACIDTPDAGVRPVGPGRAAILLAGIAGGLLVGLGVLFLTVPAAPAAAWLPSTAGTYRIANRDDAQFVAPRAANSESLSAVLPGAGGLVLTS
ncbi:MAG: Wzz/FepE/Etk N-terminal domain-containing protein [Thermoguttaceae bacterium]|jgi:uncharacterized protein involved in exopolysaccharide biosynthesis